MVRRTARWLQSWGVPMPDRVYLLAALPLFLFACADDQAPDLAEAESSAGPDAVDDDGEQDGDAGSDDGAAIPVEPTWYEDVAPVIHGHCQSCHDGSEGLSGIDLLTYESASAWAQAVGLAVEERTMPPWGAEATDSCTPQHDWKDDIRLSDDEIALISAWVEAGAPEGDRDLAAPLPEPMDTELSRVNLELTAGSWTLPPGGEDDFRCHPLQFGLDQQEWLTGLAVEATNPVVLHHAVFFYDESCASLDQVDESGSYECFGGPGIPNDMVLGAWTPGGRPTTTPEGSGMPLAPGSCMVMQAHYHPHPSRAETDPGAIISMRTTAEAPDYTAQMVIFGAFMPGAAPGLQPGPNDPAGEPTFVVPAGEADHSEQLIQDLPVPPGVDVRVWGALPHEHIAGKSVELTMLRDQPAADELSEECVVAVPRYDFSWQRTYIYDVPLSEAPIVRSGDRLRLDCTYDNTMGNRSLVELLMSEQGVSSMDEVDLVDMPLGEGTLDEMCVGIIGVAY